MTTIKQARTSFQPQPSRRLALTNHARMVRDSSVHAIDVWRKAYVSSASSTRPSPWNVTQHWVIPPSIQVAIEASRKLLELAPDWDDDGAQPISDRTWSAMAELLRGLARSAHRRSGTIIPVPSITPCSDGSIDLFWKQGGRKVLVNVKVLDSSKYSYYGEFDGQDVRGGFADLARGLPLLEPIFTG